jgi:uncharacterized protein
MEKKHFMIKFLPRKPNFVQTMTDEDRKIVVQHHEYWKKYVDSGIALLFGPVFDPKGTFGICIVAVNSATEISTLTENDPASKIHNYEYYPMNAVTQEK